MLPDLRRAPLHEAAHALGLDPFEVVRLVEASDVHAPQLEFTSEQLDNLAAFAGIEHWWETPPQLPDDVPRRPTLLRAVLSMMSDKGRVGDRTTRQDNLWRDLPADDQRFLEEAVELLTELGWVSARATPRGVQLAIRTEAEASVQAFVGGAEAPSSLARLWS